MKEIVTIEQRYEIDSAVPEHRERMIAEASKNFIELCGAGIAEDGRVHSYSIKGVPGGKALAPVEPKELAEAVRQLDVFVEGLDGCTHFQAGEIVATALQKHLRTLLARARAPRLSDAQMEAVEWFVEVQDRLLLHHLRWQAIVHEGVNAAMRHPGCEKTLAAGCADRRRRWQNANYELWASCDAARAAFAAELGEVDRG